MTVEMTILYILTGLILAGLLINFLKQKKEDASPYLKIKKKLDKDLLQANFSGEWKRRQEINLQLLWLKTINEVESRDIFSGKKSESETKILSMLSFDDIKFPLKWKLQDFYCYPFSQEIISAYGKVLAENEYKGIFKPDSILPVPKSYIKKAILFTFDYFNLKEPMHEVSDKDKYVDNLNSVNVFLDLYFINTGDDDLPKSGIENSKAGHLIKKKQPQHNGLEDLNLVDWRTEIDWMALGINYADKEQYDYAFTCYEQVKKLNPENKDLKPILSLTYLHKGEKHYENGENELAVENIKKAIELKNEEAVKWLEEYSKKQLSLDKK
jgi:tetratricopeptide (TPR) repeat protein